MNSTTTLNPSRALRLLLTLFVLLGLLGAGACAHSPTDQSIDDQADLQLTVQTFHRDMRWMRWENAAMVVTPEKREAFLARYEELGEDFHISNLEIKALEHHKEEVIVEVEQESYTEPAMIVKKKRYIEVWKKPESDWFMTRRMLKDDYKKMKKIEAARKLREQKPSLNQPDNSQPDNSQPDNSQPENSPPKNGDETGTNKASTDDKDPIQ